MHSSNLNEIREFFGCRHRALLNQMKMPPPAGPFSMYGVWVRLRELGPNTVIRGIHIPVGIYNQSINQSINLFANTYSNMPSKEITNIKC